MFQKKAPRRRSRKGGKPSVRRQWGKSDRAPIGKRQGIDRVAIGYQCLWKPYANPVEVLSRSRTEGKEILSRSLPVKLDTWREKRAQTRF